MKKELIIVAAGAAALVAYLLWRKKFANPEEYLKYKPHVNPNDHHITKAFSNAKKHAMS